MAEQRGQLTTEGHVSAHEEQLAVLRAGLEHSPLDMAITVGADHILRGASRAFRHRLPSAPTTPHTGGIGDLLGASLWTSVQPLLDRVFASGLAEIATDLEERDPAQGTRAWTYAVWPFHSPDGHVAGLMLQASETTAQRDIQTGPELREVNEQLLIAGLREQEARVGLEDASRLKDEFLATVSHELRTPITALLGYAHLLAARPHDAAYVARTAAKLTGSAKAQATLVEDLLDVSRSLTGTLRVTLAPLELVPVVQAAIDTVRPTMDAKGVQLRLALSRTDTAVVGDGQRLQQVVWNLLSNAVKFTPSGGRIDVELQPMDGQVQLLVRDTGQGISAAFLPHMFERFRQADGSSTRAAGGLGLGLAIVKQLVELHGGTIEVHSAGESQGTMVRVVLPRSAAERTADTDPATPTRPRAAGGAPPGCPPELAGLRVLVVDDQPDIVDLVDETLSGCGAEVRCHTSAATALAELRDWQPDVLIADIAMPGHDGYWLIREVRALPPEQGGATPALALTAYVHVEDRLRVLHADYQLFVPKPVEPAELRASVARLIHMHRPDQD